MAQSQGIKEDWLQKDTHSKKELTMMKHLLQ